VGMIRTLDKSDYSLQDRHFRLSRRHQGQHSTKKSGLTAVYRLAYVEAVPTYMPADKYLINASVLASGVVEMACEGVEG